MSALKHDVEEPDLMCLGDDPCVCEQLRAARIQTLEQVLFLLDNGTRAHRLVRALLSLTRGDS